MRRRRQHIMSFMHKFISSCYTACNEIKTCFILNIKNLLSVSFNIVLNSFSNFESECLSFEQISSFYISLSMYVFLFLEYYPFNRKIFYTLLRHIIIQRLLCGQPEASWAERELAPYCSSAMLELLVFLVS